MSLIDREGLCIIEDVLSEESIRGFTQLVKMRVAAGNCTEIKFGRHHCDMMRDAERDSLERQAEHILPLVEEYFAGGASFRLTQLQLLDPEPGSESQIFHVDNLKGGITFIIPLVDVEEENAPTKLLPGTHRIFMGSSYFDCASRWLKSCTFAATGSDREVDGSSEASASHHRVPVVNATVKAGSALVYDARVIHCGSENRGLSSRPALVFRYDQVGVWPPGVGVLGTIFVRLMGGAVENLAGVAAGSGSGGQR
jgi:ectoine hydroxylase-related dioxygenase (phytanoyl-CoA dioxygenase family)